MNGSDRGGWQDRPTSYKKDGACKSCAHCCGNYLPLTNADLHRIHRHLKKHILAPYVGTPMDCPFLNDNAENRCNIYEIRPLICKEYACDKQPTRSDMEKLAAKNMQPIDMRQEFFGRWLK